MTLFKSECPACGQVEITPAGVELRLCTNAPASTYLFTCPDCRRRVERRADERTIQLLIVGGVRPVQWAVPQEAFEIHTGPALNADDLIDLHDLLQQADWFDKLRAHILRRSDRSSAA